MEAIVPIAQAWYKNAMGKSDHTPIKKQPRVLSVIWAIIFSGSVFLTSVKFVNSMNSPKSYFVLLAVLCLLLSFSVFGKTIRPNSLNDKRTKWAIYLACSAQSIYGLLQFADRLPSNHRYFEITGSFDNPAGFASVLAAGFPVGLYLLTKLQGWKRYGLIAGQLIILSAIIFSGSRAGILAFAFAGIVFLLLECRERLLKLVIPRKWVLLPMAIALLGGTYLLYQQKKDSANGRLLIWQVSWEMIKDKPVLGHGYRAFQAKYMDYQSTYFRSHPDSGMAILADNVKHPFNEFLKVTVEFGFAGLLFVLVFFTWAIYLGIKTKGDSVFLAFSGLSALFVLACFSYPFQYPPSWLMLTLYLSLLSPEKEFNIGYSKATMSLRVMLAGISLLGIVWGYQQVRAETKWKGIAMKSLNGETEEMLPEYEKLYRHSSLKRQPFFLYNYGAELNYAGQYAKSTAILTECMKKFNDYDLQILLADNYEQTGETELAIQLYHYAAEMIPCRFVPLYRLCLCYKESGDTEKALEYAKLIHRKQVKIPSPTVRAIQLESEKFIEDNLQHTQLPTTCPTTPH